MPFWSTDAAETLNTLSHKIRVKWMSRKIRMKRGFGLPLCLSARNCSILVGAEMNLHSHHEQMGLERGKTVVWMWGILLGNIYCKSTLLNHSTDRSFRLLAFSFTSSAEILSWRGTPCPLWSLYTHLQESLFSEGDSPVVFLLMLLSSFYK